MGVDLYTHTLTCKVAGVVSIDISFFDYVAWKRLMEELLLEEEIQELLISWLENKSRWDDHACWLVSDERESAIETEQSLKKIVTAQFVLARMSPKQIQIIGTR